jgi:hypothetical protein
MDVLGEEAPGNESGGKETEFGFPPDASYIAQPTLLANT